MGIDVRFCQDAKPHQYYRKDGMSLIVHRELQTRQTTDGHHVRGFGNLSINLLAATPRPPIPLAIAANRPDRLATYQVWFLRREEIQFLPGQRQ